MGDFRGGGMGAFHWGGISHFGGKPGFSNRGFAGGGFVGRRFVHNHFGRRFAFFGPGIGIGLGWVVWTPSGYTNVCCYGSDCC
jgi:hypothetical protein